MTSDRTPFGRMPDGREVEQLTLRSAALTCQVITYGGALRSLTVPGKDGTPVDVLLGFDTLEDYLAQDKYMGALIGRFANRVGGGVCSLGDTSLTLARNDHGVNHLHGGKVGFDKQVWTVARHAPSALTLSLLSPDGQEGYPGELRAEVTYRLTRDALQITYRAKSSRDTLCNLTNHAYFNLSGHASGPVTGQYIQLPARSYTPTDPGSIPTGEVAAVEGTPMDLRVGLPIGQRIDDPFPQLAYAGGYDHNWVVPGPSGALRPAARAWSPDTGVVMEVHTTLPGIQFYAGNYLDGCPRGKDGAPYARRWGFCLETQTFPNAPNLPHFPTALLPKGRVYRAETVYRFSLLD